MPAPTASLLDAQLASDAQPTIVELPRGKVGAVHDAFAALLRAAA